LECAQALRKRPWADAGARVLELREAARAFGEVVDKEGRPLGADDRRTGRNRARRGLVDGIHGAHRFRNCSQLLKGPGVASIFGIENLAIVPKPGAGLQACATPASQATERKMKASSSEKPCSSTSRRAASALTSWSASAKSSAVAWGSQRSASSVTGQVACLPFST